MVISSNTIAYKGFEIKRIEGRKVRNSMRYVNRGQFYSAKDTNPLVKYVEYSVTLGKWNYSSNKLRDVKDEIESYINNQ